MLDLCGREGIKMAVFVVAIVREKIGEERAVGTAEELASARRRGARHDKVMMGDGRCIWGFRGSMKQSRGRVFRGNHPRSRVTEVQCQRIASSNTGSIGQHFSLWC